MQGKVTANAFFGNYIDSIKFHCNKSANEIAEVCSLVYLMKLIALQLFLK